MSIQELIKKYYPGKDLFKGGLRENYLESYSSADEVLEDYILDKYLMRDENKMDDVDRAVWLKAKDEFGVSDEMLKPSIADTEPESKILIKLRDQDMRVTMENLLSSFSDMMAKYKQDISYKSIKDLRELFSKEDDLPEDVVSEIFPESRRVFSPDKFKDIMVKTRYKNTGRKDVQDAIMSLFSELDEVEDYYNEPDLLNTLLKNIEKIDGSIGLSDDHGFYPRSIPNPLDMVFNTPMPNKGYIVVMTKKIPTVRVEAELQRKTSFAKDLVAMGYKEDTCPLTFIENLPINEQKKIIKYIG